jgi:hypothetical protein
VPVQPPDAAQDVVFAEDQVKVDESPAIIALGLALIDKVGAAPDTVTVADWVALPPGPAQVNVKVSLWVSAPVDIDPLIGSAPLQAPDALQLVALVDDQLIVVAVLLGIVLELAPILTVGAGWITDTVAA